MVIKLCDFQKVQLFSATVPRSPHSPYHAPSDSRIPPPRRIGRGTSTHTPLILPPHPQPLLRAQLQLPIQLRTGLLAMNEIAEPTPHTSITGIEPTARLPKVCHGAQFAINRPCGIPPRTQFVASLLRRILVLEAGVDIPDQVVVVIIADDDFLDLAEFAHFAPEILVKGVEMVLQLRGIHARFVVVGRVLVEVGEENRLRVRGFDVFARAAVSVAAGADFVVEGAVDWEEISTERV